MAQNPSVRTIDLNADDALVLFEWVSRVTDDERLTVSDPAEWGALHQLCGALERALAEPLRADYRPLLEDARRRVRERDGL